MSEKHEQKELQTRIERSNVPMVEMIAYFRIKCKSCGHHRIMHDEVGKCEGVMNKPCNSGCDCFVPE